MHATRGGLITGRRDVLRVERTLSGLLRLLSVSNQAAGWLRDVAVVQHLLAIAAAYTTQTATTSRTTTLATAIILAFISTALTITPTPTTVTLAVPDAVWCAVCERAEPTDRVHDVH